MSGVDWVGGYKGSSFLQEIIKFSIFSPCVIVLSGLVGDSRYSYVNLGEFFQ